jgi:hypothetical protein
MVLLCPSQRTLGKPRGDKSPPHTRKALRNRRADTFCWSRNKLHVQACMGHKPGSLIDLTSLRPVPSQSSRWIILTTVHSLMDWWSLISHQCCTNMCDQHSSGYSIQFCEPPYSNDNVLSWTGRIFSSVRLFNFRVLRAPHNWSCERSVNVELEWKSCLGCGQFSPQTTRSGFVRLLKEYLII